MRKEKNHKNPIFWHIFSPILTIYEVFALFAKFYYRN